MKLSRILLIIFLICQSWPSFAFNPANPYWINLKVKLNQYLDKTINKSEYKYDVVVPAKEMTNFLGNRPDAEVKFEGLVLNSPSYRKSIVAVVYDETGKRLDSIVINLDVLVYRNVYMLKQSVAARDEILEGNVYESRIPIRQMDENLYYHGPIKQKVASTNITAGTPLKVNIVRHEKIVQVGDMINIKSGSKFIALEFICKAMTSGDVGDTITVNCQEMHNKTMKAEITGPGTANLI